MCRYLNGLLFLENFIHQILCYSNLMTDFLKLIILTFLCLSFSILCLSIDCCRWLIPSIPSLSWIFLSFHLDCLGIWNFNRISYKLTKNSGLVKMNVANLRKKSLNIAFNQSDEHRCPGTGWNQIQKSWLCVTENVHHQNG